MFILAVNLIKLRAYITYKHCVILHGLSYFVDIDTYELLCTSCGQAVRGDVMSKCKLIPAQKSQR